MLAVLNPYVPPLIHRGHTPLITAMDLELTADSLSNRSHDPTLDTSQADREGGFAPPADETPDDETYLKQCREVISIGMNEETNKISYYDVEGKVNIVSRHEFIKRLEERFTLLPLGAGTKMPPAKATYSAEQHGGTEGSVRQCGELLRSFKFCKKLMGQGDPYDVAIMLKGDAVCFDFDNMEAFATIPPFVKEFLDTCPGETTRKGRHYYATDPRLIPKTMNLFGKGIDYLVCATTGTPSLSVCFPSKNKEMMDKNVMNTDPPQVPQSVIDWVREGLCHRQRSNERRQEIVNLAAEATYPIQPEYSKLLPLIDYDDYQTWFAVCCIFKKEQWSFEAFDKWSSLSDKYNRSDTEKQWAEIKSGRKDKVQLHALAQLKAPQQYQATTEGDLFTKGRDIVEREHCEYDLACLMRSYFPTAKTTHLKSRECFMADESGKWVALTPDVMIGIMGETFGNGLFKDLSKHYYAEWQKDPESDPGKQQKKFMSQATNIGNSFKQTKTQEAIKSQFYQLTYDKYFLDKLDETNKFLMGFENGVYDFKVGEFRRYEPTDYVSLSTGYDFPRRRDLDPIAVKQLEDFLSSVFGSIPGVPLTNDQTETMNYLIATIAACMNGDNAFEDVYCWTGDSGRNGKGCIADLVRQVFGEYFKMLNIDVITKGRNGGQATPELALAKGKRFLALTEPETNDALQVSTLKKLRGGDMLEVRQLHKDPIQMKPQFTLYLQSNGIPRLSVPDRAIEQTLKAVPFEYEFCSRDNYTMWQSKGNADIMKYKRIGSTSVKGNCSKNTKWRDVFLFNLLDLYDKVVRPALDGNNSSVPCPKSVKTTTQDYMEDQDFLKEFLEKWCDQHDDCLPKHRTTLTNVLTKYNQLYGKSQENNYQGVNIGKARMKAQLKFAKMRIEKDRRGVSVFGLTLRKDPKIIRYEEDVGLTIEAIKAFRKQQNRDLITGQQLAMNGEPQGKVREAKWLANDQGDLIMCVEGLPSRAKQKAKNWADNEEDDDTESDDETTTDFWCDHEGGSDRGVTSCGHDATDAIKAVEVAHGKKFEVVLVRNKTDRCIMVKDKSGKVWWDGRSQEDKVSQAKREAHVKQREADGYERTNNKKGVQRWKKKAAAQTEQPTDEEIAEMEEEYLANSEY